MAEPGQTLDRSPADVFRLVVALAVLGVVLLVELLIGDTAVDFFAELFEGVEALPDWLLEGVVIAARLGFVVAAVASLVTVAVHRHWRLLVMAAAAGAAGSVVVEGLSQFIDTSAPAIVELGTSLGPLTDENFPPIWVVGGVAAALTAAAPWMGRRTRRWGWALIIVMTMARLLAEPVLANTPLALAAGWAVGAAALVIAGAPSRRPSTTAIRTGLEAVGVDLVELEPASVDARGSTPYFGATDETRLFVKVLGVDERSADLLFRIYRRMIPRDLGDQRVFSSLRRAVEHEALVALASSEIGVRTPPLAAFATAEPNGYVLAYEAIEGRSLDGVDADDLTDERLAEIWSQIALLRSHGIAHRDLRLANVFLAADGQIWIIDFGFSELAASQVLLATDLAQLLTSLSLQVGAERAVASARTALSDDTLATATDRLASYALAGATRTALSEEPGLLDDLRRRVSI